GERAPELILRDALRWCNTTVRLGPAVTLDYSHKFKDPTSETPNEEVDLRPLRFAQCVKLTSVNDFNFPTSEARTPRSLGPLLHYGDPESSSTFLSVSCDDEEQKQEPKGPWGDHVWISGFRVFGTTDDRITANGWSCLRRSPLA